MGLFSTELFPEIFEGVPIVQFQEFLHDHERVVPRVVQEVMRRTSVHDEVVLLVVIVSGVASVLVYEIAAVGSQLEPYEFLGQETCREIPVDLLVEILLVSVLQFVNGVALLEFLTGNFAFLLFLGRFVFRVRLYRIEQYGILRLGVKDPATFSVLGIDRARQAHHSRDVLAGVIGFDVVAVEISVQHLVDPVHPMGVGSLVELPAATHVIGVHAASREDNERPLLEKLVAVHDFFYSVDDIQDLRSRQLVS